MSLKRIAPNWWLRVKSGATLGYVSLVLAVTGILVTITVGIGITTSVWAISKLTLVCLALSLVGSYLRGRMKYLPDSLVDDMSSDSPYSATFCSAPILREACEMTKPYYKHEYVSADIAEQWRIKNPKAFVQITNSEGELCACFGILSLKDGFMGQFIDGKVSDTQLGENNICSFKDSRKSKHLYISGVVVRDAWTYNGSKRARVMTWAILKYLEKLYGLRRKRSLYAIAVTKEAERLMNNLDFKLLGRARRRVDKCNMYKYQLSKASWEKLMKRVGDYSPMCKCKL